MHIPRNIWRCSNKIVVHLLHREVILTQGSGRFECLTDFERVPSYPTENFRDRQHLLLDPKPGLHPPRAGLSGSFSAAWLVLCLGGRYQGATVAFRSQAPGSPRAEVGAVPPGSRRGELGIRPRGSWPFLVPVPKEKPHGGSLLSPSPHLDFPPDADAPTARQPSAPLQNQPHCERKDTSHRPQERSGPAVASEASPMLARAAVTEPAHAGAWCSLCGDLVGFSLLGFRRVCADGLRSSLSSKSWQARGPGPGVADLDVWQRGPPGRSFWTPRGQDRRDNCRE